MRLDDDRDGDKIANGLDVFPDDPKEWSDLDGDGEGNNSDSDIDGDGYSNQQERAEKTDPHQSISYPDHIKPVLEQVNWSATNQVSGMAFDDGMGVDKIWVEDSTGKRWQGSFSYTSHFRLSIKGEFTPPITLILKDKAGNQTRQAIYPKGQSSYQVQKGEQQPDLDIEGGQRDLEGGAFCRESGVGRRTLETTE